MAYIPNSNSVVAFQGNPSVLQVLATVTNPNQSISGIVGASVIGHAPVVIVGGSIAASFTPPANQSVSGTVDIGNFPAVQPVAPNNSSIYSLQQAGSVLAVSGSFSPAGNQSVSGTVQADIRGSVATVIIGGSIAASFTPPANQSVSGEVSISNFPVSQNVNGSVVSFQGTTPWVNTNVGSIITVPQSSTAVAIVSGSIAVSVTPPANQSVSGTVGASVIGTVPITQSGTIIASVTNIIPSSLLVGASIIGLTPVNVTNFPTSQNVSGSVVAFQGTTPWANTNVGSVITVGQGSIAVNIIAGSVAVATGNSSVQVLNFPANQSVSGTVGASIIGTVPVVQSGTFITSVVNTVPSSMLVGASIIGLTPVNVTNFPTTQNVSGSVAAWLNSSNASVITVGSPVANQSVSGTVTANQGTGFGSIASHIKSGSVIAVLGGNTSVLAIQSGTWRTSVTNIIPSSMLVGASIIGLTPVSQGGTWIASVFGNMSVLGTVPVTQSGTWQPSALAYVTRNDNIASFLGANLSTRPAMSDSAGRLVTKPFSPEESRVEGYHSVVSTSQTTLVAAAGAGLRNYITDIFIANTGATTTLVTFKDGAGSILGYTIAPTAGGSNMPGLATPFRTGANASFDFQATSASSILYATVKGFKAP